MSAAKHWELWLGDELLARLHQPSLDWPWIYCDLEPVSPRFDAFRDYFSDDAALDRVPEALFEEIHARRLRLVAFPSGEEYLGFSLHVEGETVWFRV